MARNSNNQRGRNNNNAEGRNQYGNGWVDTAKERPMATAAAVGGAVAAGVFLWSRRNQISDQLSHMSEQISDWSENMRSGSSSQSDTGSSFQSSGRSSTPMGVETGRTELAGAGTSAARKSTRATGGRSGKSQTGQTMSPSRDMSSTPSM